MINVKKLLKARYYLEEYGERIVIPNVLKAAVIYFVDAVIECWNIDNKITNKILDEVKYKHKDDKLTIYLEISESGLN